jgi:hypothetical protein
MSAGRYLEMGVLGPSEWTRQLQDPQHKEEQETPLYLKYGQGIAEYLCLTN